MLLARASGATGVMAGACTGLWRSLAGGAVGGGMGGSRQMATSVTDPGDRPMAGDPAVRQARQQQPNSVSEPPLLHDSLSGADYAYSQRRGPTGVVRMSSISEPDYYLHNSLSEGSYDMPKVLQSASLNTRRGQGFSTGKQRPIVQRIVVANRAGAQEPQGPLQDSFSHGEYTPRYK